MSFTSSCPRCQKQVTVPNEAAAEAIVRCPLCSAEYPLSESLALVPPALIIVSGAAVPALQAAGAGALGGVAAEAVLAEPPAPREPWDLVEEEAVGGDGKGVALAPEEEGGLEGIEKEVDFAALTGRAPPAAAAEGAAVAAPVPPLKKRRPKREATPLGLFMRFVGMAIAAALGLGTAYLIGSYFKEDVDNGKYGLHLFHNPPNVQEEVTDPEAPQTPSAPKPEPRVKAAPAAENAKPQATAKPAAQNPQGSKPGPAAGPGPKAPARTPSSKTVAKAKAGSEEPPDLPEKIDLAAEPKDPLAFPKEKIDPFLPPETAFQPVRVGPAKKAEPEAKAEPPAKPEPKVEPPGKPKPKDERAAKPETPAAPLDLDSLPQLTPAEVRSIKVVNRTSPRGSPKFTATDLRRAVTDATEACEAKPLGQLSDEAYGKLRQLAAATTLADGCTGEDLLPAAEVFARIARSGPAMERVTALARKALEAPDKAHGGVLLPGTVAKVAEKNGLCGVVLKTEASAGAVMLLRDADLAVKENDRLLVAGSIVHDPAKNIPGYTGSQRYVIWVGDVCNLP